MPAPHLNPAKPAVLPGFHCEACKAAARLSDLNDDMLCEACAGPVEPRGWVPRRELLEG